MGFSPVDEAAEVRDFAERGGAAARPDLILAGLPVTVAEVEPLVHELHGWAPAAKIVLIAPDLDMPALIACFGAGASGYLLDSISREALDHSLQLVSIGENVFPSQLASVLTASRLILVGSNDLGPELRELQITPRQVQVLRHLAGGRSNQEIANLLSASETAVSAEVRHVLRKLKVANRTQAALWAVAKGLAVPFGA
jgi:two-component system nitrate/nitrite response regulator NarL